MTQGQLLIEKLTRIIRVGARCGSIALGRLRSRCISRSRGQPPRQDCVQALGLHRFGHEAIHAGFATALAVFLESIGSQGQDRQAGSFGQLSDAPARLEPVHNGHLDVHEHKIEGFAVDCLHRLGTILHGRHRQRDGGEQRLGDLPVQGAVFNQQHPRSATNGERCRLRHALLDLLLRAGPLRAQREPERTALTRRGEDADFPSHHLDQAATDSQAETGTSVLARNAGVSLLERLEQAGLLLCRHADAGVLHLEAQ